MNEQEPAPDDQCATDPSAAEAVVRVDIAAAPDDVWQALTTDDGLAGWFGGGSSIGADVGDELDLHDLVTGQRKRGVLDEVTPGQRLGYTWWPETRPHDATRVAISIEPTHAGTRVTVVESRPLRAGRSAVAHSSVLAFAGGSIARVGHATSTADWAWRATVLTVFCGSRVMATSLRAPHGR